MNATAATETQTYPEPVPTKTQRKRRRRTPPDGAENMPENLAHAISRAKTNPHFLADAIGAMKTRRFFIETGSPNVPNEVEEIGPNASLIRAYLDRKAQPGAITLAAMALALGIDKPDDFCLPPDDFKLAYLPLDKNRPLPIPRCQTLAEIARLATPRMVMAGDGRDIDLAHACAAAQSLGAPAAPSEPAVPPNPAEPADRALQLLERLTDNGKLQRLTRILHILERLSETP